MIFMDLRKVYEILDRDRFLDILEGYGLCPQVFHIICACFLLIADGGSHGLLLRSVFLRFSGGDSGGPAAPHSF